MELNTADNDLGIGHIYNSQVTNLVEGSDER